MPDLLNETVLSLAEAARLIPGCRGSERINPSTVFRWATRGTRSPSGRVIRLESFRVGCRLMTSRQAIGRYVAALSEQDGGEPSQAVRTPHQVKRSSARAEAELIAIGG